MLKKYSFLGLGVFAGLVLVLAGWQVFDAFYKYQGSVIDPPVPAADFELVDQHAQPFRLSEQRGKVVLAFFGYTHCPDVCPVTLSEYKQIKERLGKKADDIRFVLISVDPERDTPEVIHEYLENFDPRFFGLTGDIQTLEAVWKNYGVYQARQERNSASGYLVDHSSQVYVIDRQGNWRMTYSFGTEIDLMVDDLSHLLREK